MAVLVSPVIPGLNDRDIPAVLEQAAAAGARSASYTALRLPGSVEQVFVKRLREVMPLRADRVMNRLRDIRNGRINETRFGKRMRGQGPYWQSICEMFAVFKRRYGLDDGASCDSAPAESRACEPHHDDQLTFDFKGEAPRRSGIGCAAD